MEKIKEKYLGHDLVVAFDKNKTVGSLFSRKKLIVTGEVRCKSEDKFDKRTGLKLIKLLLSRKYHLKLRDTLDKSVKELEKQLSYERSRLSYHTNKAKNAKIYLSKVKRG